MADNKAETDSGQASVDYPDRSFRRNAEEEPKYDAQYQIGDKVWVIKDRSKGRYAHVFGKVVKVTEAWDGGWIYTVRDSDGNDIKDIEESKLEPE